MRRLAIAARLAVVGLALGRLAPPAAVAGDPPNDPFGPVRRPGGVVPPSPRSEPAPPSLDALRPWLAHPDWLTRALAARELTKRSEDGVVTMLTSALSTETDPRVALFLLKSLAGRPRDDLLVEGGAGLVDTLLP